MSSASWLLSASWVMCISGMVPTSWSLENSQYQGNEVQSAALFISLDIVAKCSVSHEKESDRSDLSVTMFSCDWNG
ncbi:hypothetical protein QQG55_39185 [Brugia pahangi]